MLSFISFWRAAAIVLNDLGSSAYYVGGIAEQAVGRSAPWFILGVMLFSYAVRAVYVESCAMFTRGGVYRVVKEAMGGTLAKLSVSALMFDYILTGPISGVSAGQYIVGLDRADADLLRPSVEPSKEHDQSHRGRNRRSHHALFLVAQHAGHSRIVRRRAEDHVRHDGDGRDADSVERHDDSHEDRRRSGCRPHQCLTICHSIATRLAGCRKSLPGALQRVARGIAPSRLCYPDRRRPNRAMDLCRMQARCSA